MLVLLNDKQKKEPSDLILCSHDLVPSKAVLKKFIITYLDEQQG